MVDPSFLDLEALYQECLQELGETARGRERVLPILLGDAEPQTDFAAFHRSQEASEGHG